MRKRALFLGLLTTLLVACDGDVTEPDPEEPDFLAFMSRRDGNLEIHRMSPDGTNPLNLTNHPAEDGAPDWSPDRQRIAFHSTRDGNREIYVMNADGTGAARLTTTSTPNWWPAWSPNGRQIVFVRGAANARNLYVMNADGTTPVQLSQSAGDNYAPKWSPDGKRIAFASNRSGNYDIYVMNADGTGVRQLTSNPELGADFGLDAEPAWSPDGRRIVFRSRREGYCGLFTMNADGTGLSPNLTPKPADVPANDWCNNFPAWSPDGRRIFFASLRPTEAGVQLDLYVMNADGTELQRLTNHPAADLHPAIPR